MNDFWKWLFGFFFTVFLLWGTAGCKSAGQYMQEYGDASVNVLNGLQESGADYSAEIYVPWNMDLSWSPFGFEGGIPGAYLKAHIKKGNIYLDSFPLTEKPKNEETDNSVVVSGT